MSGAFHRFNGLSNNHTKSERARSAHSDVSEPCLYREHRDHKHGWRSTDTGACLDCLEHQLRTPRPSFDISRIRSMNRTRALRFWSKVDITTLDDCWKYEGSSNKQKLLFMWRRPRLKNTYSYHSIRVATWLSWGDFGNCGVRSLCGERRCCNPLHNVPEYLTDKDIASIDKTLLEAQLETLRRQIQNYLLTKSEQKIRRGLQSTEHDESKKLFLPTIKPIYEGFDDDQEVITEYHQAMQDTLIQLKNCGHVSQL